MNKLIVDEMCLRLNWYERILVKIFKRTFCKIYRTGCNCGFNFCNK